MIRTWVRLILGLVILLGYESAAFGGGGNLTRAGNTVVGADVTDATQTTNPVPPTGGFSTIEAHADDDAIPSTASSSLKPPFPYIVNPPRTYDTLLQKAPGVRFDPQAEVTATTNKLGGQPPNVSWTADPTKTEIVVTTTPTVAAEVATARWSVFDPATFAVNPGDKLTVAFHLNDGLGMIFPDPSPGVSYSSLFSGFAQSDLPGLGSLFSFSIGLNSLKPNTVNVLFTSNPLLGMNDTAVSAGLAGRFTYDPATGDYAFNSSGLSLGASIVVPAGASEATITTGAQDQLMAQAVPEPNTLISAGIGLTCLLGVTWRKCRRGRVSRSVTC